MIAEGGEECVCEGVCEGRLESLEPREGRKEDVVLLGGRISDTRRIWIGWLPVFRANDKG